MTKFDKQYLELCKRILTEGVEVENRTGINTLKIPSHTFTFNLEDEFPILESKQTAFKTAIIEMLWIWQMQSNDVRELTKRGVHIWDEWMIDADGIYRIYEPNTSPNDYNPDKEVPLVVNCIIDENNPYGEIIPMIDESGKQIMVKGRIAGKNIKYAQYFGKELAYTIGTAYGYITKRYQHTQNLINTIKNNPNDRRMVKSLWQDEFIRTATLPSCVWSTEWDVTKNKLNLSVHQRSCDVALGLPFNVTQYATFLKMIAQVTDLEPGTISYSIKDAHIYVNHLKNIKEQIRRWDEYKRMNSMNKDLLNIELADVTKALDYTKKRFGEGSKEYKELTTHKNIIDFTKEHEKPEVVLNKEIKDFFKFDNSKNLNDIKLKKYKHLGKLHFDIAQ